MSLLTPLYIAGLLAVSLPLVFHLIRRMPRGEFPFSSLMFLSASPPRLTKRSRLDNLLLLLLRAAVLALLAAAFTRPFLRESSRLDVDQAVRRKIVLVIDTSASMRRDGLWPQAVAEVDKVLDELGPRDDVALLAFNSKVDMLAPLGDADAADPSQRPARLRALLEDLTPSWAASNTGDALIRAADELHASADATDSSVETVRQVVLISDLGQGSRLDSLGAYQWPDDVRLAVRPVKAAKQTNAGLSLAASRPEEGETPQEGGLRVRVSNDRDSAGEQFQLRWVDENGSPAPGPGAGVFVPPGASRTIRVPRPADPQTDDRLALFGDDHPFDNTLYLVPLVQEEVPLVYLGDEAADGAVNDAQGLHYYLARAFPETARRKVRLVVLPTQRPLSDADLQGARLIVVGSAPSDSATERLVELMAEGRTVLLVMRDAAAGRTLAKLMGNDDVTVEEATSNEYAMLGEIDFGHPLFSPLADPRFNDFTKIHFWRHRHVQWPQELEVQALARFDDGHPALFEQTLGDGKLVVFTSGWHPSDSQLARSSKFAPLLARLLELSGVPDTVAPQYEIGDAVVPAVARADVAAGSVRKPDGTELLLASDDRRFDQTDEPGVYRWTSQGRTSQFAVNVSPAESRTAPFAVEELQQRGAKLGRHATRAELAAERRQMRDIELEGRQKLWQWLIAAALAVLVAETWLAGRLAVRSPAAETTG